MIDVAELSKRYHAVQAVDRLTFGVDRGEIVGFLGPNGAGKTTTMRMLTTFLTPTSGRATLAGFDVLDAPLEVRRHVGYLPEGVPLYPEMRVREYLNFRAQIKDVPAANAAARSTGSWSVASSATSSAGSSATCPRAIASGSGWPRRCSTTPTS